MLRKLIVVLIVLAVLLTIGDVVAVNAASANMRKRLQEEVRGAGSVHGRIESFPFTGRLLAWGAIQDVHIRLDRLDAGPLTFASLRADLHGVKIDRNLLLLERKVRLVDLKRGTVSAELSQEEVSKRIGVPVRFRGDGKAAVTVRGATAAASVGLSNGRLTLKAGPLPSFGLPIPKAPLLPCTISQLKVSEGKVRASCTVEDLPEELLRLDVLHAA